MYKVENKVFLLLFGRLLQTVLAVLSIRFLTTFLSQIEIGHQYLINSILLWFSLVLINPVGMYVNRYLHEWREKRQLYFYVLQLNKYFAAIAFLSLPIVYIARTFFGLGEFLPSTVILLFIVCYIYFSTWFQTLISVFNLFDFQKTFVLMNVFSQACGLLLAGLAVKLFQSSAIVWMTGLLGGQIISLVIVVFLLRKSYPEEKYNLIPFNGGIFTKSTFNFCYPVAMTTLFVWFMSQGYRLIIERNLGAETLASIGVGLGVAASLAGVIESITTQYFYPKYYEALANSNLEQRSKSWVSLWKKTSIVYIPGAFLIIAVSSLVVRVLTGANFHHVVPYVWFGAFIELFRQLSNIAYLVSHAEKKTYNTIAPYLLGGSFLAFVLMMLANKDILGTNLILVALTGAGCLTYICNLIVVKTMIPDSFDFKIFFKSAIVSTPLLLPPFFLAVNSSLLLLFGVGILCGLWCLSSIYLMLKNS